MAEIVINLPDEKASSQFAGKLAARLQAPAIIGFSGQLGAGKTTIIRAMLRALNIEGPIKSPSYALIESYDCPDFILHHFDLYRIADEDELEYIGFRDFFGEDSVCCIEWPDKTKMSSQVLDVHLNLDFADHGRQLVIRTLTPRGKRMMKGWNLQ